MIVTVPVGVTVQTVAELLAKVTASLLEAVATRLNGATPRATSAGLLNVIVCAAAAFGVGIFPGTASAAVIDVVDTCDAASAADAPKTSATGIINRRVARIKMRIAREIGDDWRFTS